MNKDSDDEWVMVEDDKHLRLKEYMVCRDNRTLWWGYCDTTGDWLVKFGSDWKLVKDVTHWKPVPRLPIKQELGDE